MPPRLLPLHPAKICRTRLFSACRCLFLPAICACATFSLVANAAAAACGQRPPQELARWLRQGHGYVLHHASARCGSACLTSTRSECLAAAQLVLPYRPGRWQAAAGVGCSLGSECVSPHCLALCLAMSARARSFTACRRCRGLLICLFWQNSCLTAAAALAGLPAAYLDLQAGLQRSV